jgi:hypothetical protein
MSSFAATAFRDACSEGDLDLARRVQAAWPDACLHAVAQAFRAACGNGHEGVAKWLWAERRASIDCKNGFVRACKKGRLLLAKWLWTEVRVPVPFVADAFVEACSKGHLRVAQWLWALGHVEHNGPLTGVFWKACLGGHLAVAQWLWRVSRDPVDVTIHNYCALRGAAKHPCMLPWVWSLARDVVPDVIMASVFESACGQGDLAVIPWLWDVCSVRSKPHMLGDGFVHACEEGHLEAAQWLWANDAVQTEDVQVALHAACTEGHLRVVQWLVHICGGAIDETAFVSASGNGFLDIAQWLLDVSGMSGNVPEALRRAVAHDELPAAQWLHGLGCQVKDDMIVDACTDQSVGMVKWLVRLTGTLPPLLLPGICNSEVARWLLSTGAVGVPPGHDLQALRTWSAGRAAWIHAVAAHSRHCHVVHVHG